MNIRHYDRLSSCLPAVPKRLFSFVQVGSGLFSFKFLFGKSRPRANVDSLPIAAPPLTLCSHWLTLVNNKKKSPGIFLSSPSRSVRPLRLNNSPLRVFSVFRGKTHAAHA
jgi:hypothetical protein